jgi:hypothetical protein
MRLAVRMRAAPATRALETQVRTPWEVGAGGAVDV